MFVVETATFRRTAYRPTVHNGEPWLMAQCWEWVGGKWEGFISLVRV